MIAADDAGGTIAGADEVAEREDAYAALVGAVGAFSTGFSRASNSSCEVIGSIHFKAVTACGLALHADDDLSRGGLPVQLQVLGVGSASPISGLTGHLYVVHASV